jgi:hypothetical protein
VAGWLDLRGEAEKKKWLSRGGTSEKKSSRVIVFPLKCQQKNGRVHQSAAGRLRREGVP